MRSTNRDICDKSRFQKNRYINS